MANIKAMQLAIDAYEQINWSEGLTEEDKIYGMEHGFLASKRMTFEEEDGILPEVYFIDEARKYEGYEEAEKLRISPREMAERNGFKFLSSKDFSGYQYASLIDLNDYLDTQENRERARRALELIESNVEYGDIASAFIEAHEEELVDYYEIEKEAYEERLKERERQEEVTAYGAGIQNDDDEASYVMDGDMDGDYSDGIGGGQDILDDGFDYDF